MLPGLGRAAARVVATTRFAGLVPAAAASAMNECRQAHALALRDVSDDDPAPSLRKRLEADAAAEWSYAERETATAARSGLPSLRTYTSTFAHRLAKTAECQLEQGTPRYLDSAMDPTTKQMRLVVEAEQPYRITWASGTWQALTGLGGADAAGRPALCALPAAGSAPLLESLALHERGCATVAWPVGRGQRAFPARVTVSPLIANATGDVSHMLFVLKPL